jgi:hypothetical protein
MSEVSGATDPPFSGLYGSVTASAPQCRLAPALFVA